MSDYIYGIGQELRFNTLGTDLTHTWDFGDGTPISSDPSPTHIYSIPGSYTVIHGARDFCGSCLSLSHTVDIVTASITIRSLLLNTYTSKVGDIVTATVIAQNLSPIYGTGSIVVRFNTDVAGTFNATLESNQEVSFDISRQVTTAGTINVCADNVCTVLFVESQVRVESITLDTNVSTGNPIIATIGVRNNGTTEDKTIQTTLTNNITIVIDERIISAIPGTSSYQVPVTITGLSNGLYTLCAENVCKALSVAIPTETTGRLSISSTPIGAEIFVDALSTSQYTNATVIGISPGNHTFTLKMNGYNDTVGSFTITVGMITYVYTALSPIAPTTGNINISSTPSGAEIYIDNNQQFDINNQPTITPATITGLLATSSNITLKLSDYIDYNKTIDIIAGQTTYLSASLIHVPIIIGNINFITMPAGAEIFIDNNPTGQTTPATITDVSIGIHEFILKYPGRNDSTGTIDVIGGMTSYIHVDMSIVPSTIGDLDISSTPSGAEIYIDNNQQFDINNQPITTPATIIDLSPASYYITLKLPGYIDYNKTMSIVAGQTTYLGASLIPTPIIIGNINFVTIPSGASIFIDNQEQVGKLTPITIADIPIGSHTFILKYSGRNDATGSVDVTGGATSYIYVDMSITPPTEGNIAISSDPPNAEIWINDIRQLDINNNPLLTPSTITGLSPTSYDITLKLSGYIDYNKTIDIIAGQTTYLSASLLQEPILVGDINFTTNPDGASIFIDNQEQIGKFTPTTITDISIGSHPFILKYSGRNYATGSIDVTGGATSYVYINMSIVSPTKGSISISSIPQDADIYIDTVIYSTKTPTTIDDLAPNVYTIVLKKTGYNDYTTMINAIAGQTISINITLIPTAIIVAELGFPWWLALGIGVGMFHAGKYKELKDIREIVSSEVPFRHKGHVVTLTKSDYKIT